MPDLTDRDRIEAEFANALAKELERFARTLGKVIPGLQSAFESVPREEWDRHTDKLSGIVTPTMAGIFRSRARDIIDNLGFTDVDWGLVDAESAAWARNYAGRLIKGITDTSQVRVRQLVGDYFEYQQTQGDLTRALMAENSTFSRSRAEMIARTEVTQAASEGTQDTRRQLASQGIEMVTVWNTRNDELANNCPICGPRNGKVIEDGQFPPGHPRCRCWPALEFPK